MIFDTLKDSVINGSLGPRFTTGLQWLAQLPPGLPDGRVDLEGDNVYALVQSYDTVPATEKHFESHRAYADIQFIVEGTEVIHYAPVANLTPLNGYNTEKDFLLYADPAVSTPLHCPRGTFAIFHPHDGHKPGCTSGASCFVRKVVIKVRL